MQKRSMKDPFSLTHDVFYQPVTVARAQLVRGMLRGVRQAILSVPLLDKGGGESLERGLPVLELAAARPH